MEWKRQAYGGRTYLDHFEAELVKGNYTLHLKAYKPGEADSPGPTEWSVQWTHKMGNFGTIGKGTVHSIPAAKRMAEMVAEAVEMVE